MEKTVKYPDLKVWVEWQQSHGRNGLPWQQNQTWYRVWLSEVMLQQTQVETVKERFARWMEVFPTVEDLASSEESAILAEWSGLGYYRRAKNVHLAAKHIAGRLERNDGWPTTEEEWVRVPGVGKSTARAIVSQMGESFLPICDGNVRRWLSRLEGKIVGEKEAWEVLSRVFDGTDPDAKHMAPKIIQAQMDLGNGFCKPRTVSCENCLLKSVCKSQAAIPWKVKIKREKPVVLMHVQWNLNGHGQVFLEQRGHDGIWPGLWFLPEADSRTNLLGVFKHELTHRIFEIHVWESVEEKTFNAFHWEEVQKMGRPSILDKIFAEIGNKKLKEIGE